MRALVFNGPWDMTVEERPDPAATAADETLQILATGICGSDLHGYTGENGRRHPGQVMGHETVGRLLSGSEAGALVTVNPVIGCGSCSACRAGQSQRCPARRVIGVTADISAAFAELMAAPAPNVHRLGEAIEPTLGALVEPLAVGYHAARRALTTADDRVLVVGGGPIGQAAAVALWRLGHEHVVVSEPSTGRRALLGSLGVDCVDPASGGLADLAAAHLGGRPTVVIDAVGCTDTLSASLEASDLGARIVLVGMHTPTVSVPAYAISTEERTVIGSFCYSNDDFASTAEWVGSTSLPLDRLIDDQVPMDDAPAAFDGLARGSIVASKVLVQMDGASRPAGRP